MTRRKSYRQNERRDPQDNTPKQVEAVAEDTSETVMRLQKFLARAGVASRRGSEELISAGRITINGVVASKLGTKVDAATDEVCVDGKPVTLQTDTVTLMLNKPAGYVTTMKDPQGRPCVAELVPTDDYPALFPVGRLDRDTSGLLLFSTDGELGNKLLHPSFHVDKTYLALVKGTPSEAALQLLREGLPLEDGMTAPAKVEVLTGDARERALQEVGSAGEQGVSGVGQRHAGAQSRKSLEKNATMLAITIHEGRNRQVRRMCAAVGHEVIALHRRSFGSLTLSDLPKGSWRLLDTEELALLTSASIR